MTTLPDPGTEIDTSLRRRVEEPNGHEGRQFFALKEVMTSIRGGGDPYPHCVEVHPTDFCNQRCSYCFHGGVGEDLSRRSELLSAADYAELIAEIDRLGVGEVSVSGGGEPLLYKEIEPLLATIVASRCDLRVVTNGNFIPERLDELLLQSLELRFSIDSIQSSVYAAQRGLRNGRLLERTLENVGRLTRKRNATGSRTKIVTTCLVTDLVADDLEGFTRTCIDELDVDKVAFKRDIYNPDNGPDVGVVLTELRARYGDRVEVRGSGLELATAGACCVPYIKLSLNPYGEVYSCCLGAQPGEVNGVQLGSLRESGSFEELWRTSSEVRRRMAFEGVGCRDCNETDKRLNHIWREDLAPSEHLLRENLRSGETEPRRSL